MWLALAGSAIGVYTASMYLHRKFSVFELVYSAISVKMQIFRAESLILHVLTIITTQEQLSPSEVSLVFSVPFSKTQSGKVSTKKES